jgi:predicted transcriptional regulator
MANKALRELRFMKVENVMKKDIASIEGKQTAFDAIKIMREKKVSSLLVNRRGKEDAWGIITRKDVVNKIIDPGKNPKEVSIHEIMSKPLVMVSPGLALKYCARLFHQAGIRRAPVFDGKEIVGMISNTDIFNALLD